MAVPTFLQSCLWSYDLSKLDKHSDYQLIIGQTLNWGNQQQIDWVQSNYSPELIQHVLRHPSRGMWFRSKLRHWLQQFNIMIDPLDFEAAIIDLNPRIKLTQAWFTRKGII